MNNYEESLMKLAVERHARESGTSSPNAPQSDMGPTPSPTSSLFPALSSASVPTAQSKGLSNSLSYSTLDVFTKIRFTGNQLAIVHVPSSLSISGALTQGMKQRIACEFNLSETVFLHDSVPGSLEHRLDIFTLKDELPFAGHPVIGTINYMCRLKDPPFERVTLLCKAGPIVGMYHHKETIAQAEIPHYVRIHRELVPSRLMVNSQPDTIQNVLAVDFFPVVSIVKGLSFVLINLPSAKPYLEMLDPSRFNFDASKVTFDEGWDVSFIGAYFYSKVSHPNTEVSMIRARMLEPSVGEDAATGSAASTLACFLALKDGTPSKTYRFNIQQGVEMGRASDIGVSVTLDATGKALTRVILAGSAVLVTQGTMILPKS